MRENEKLQGLFLIGMMWFILCIPTVMPLSILKATELAAALFAGVLSYQMWQKKLQPVSFLFVGVSIVYAANAVTSLSSLWFGVDMAMAFICLTFALFFLNTRRAQ